MVELRCSQDFFKEGDNQEKLAGGSAILFVL